jgi:hypothetical protein
MKSTPAKMMEFHSLFRIRNRIWIRIGSAFDGLLDPGPHYECGSGSRSKRGKISLEKEEKISLKIRKNCKISIFYAIIF